MSKPGVGSKFKEGEFFDFYFLEESFFKASQNIDYNAYILSFDYAELELMPMIYNKIFQNAKRPDYYLRF